MKIYFILVLCISFIACQNKTKTYSQYKEPVEMIVPPAVNETSDNKYLENMSETNRKKYQFELTEHTGIYDSLVYKYWENLSDKERGKVLQSENVAEDVIRLYNGQFILSDDDTTFELLDELTSRQSDTGLKALYFYLFNKILLYSDGALAEGILEYALEIFMSDVPYALEYLTVNNEMMERYGSALAVELYYQQDTTTSPMTLSELKSKVKTDLKGNDKYDELLSVFYEVIENMMQKMN